MRRPRLSAFSVVLLIVGASLLYLALADAGPVIRAARAGEGLPGTFTAQRQSCVRHPGHTACSWEGEFRSEDGTVTRSRVFLHGGSGGLRPQAVVKARDVGRRTKVYRPEGTREWISTALFALAGLVLLTWPLLRRTERTAPTAPTQPAATEPRATEPDASAGTEAARAEGDADV